MEAETDSQDQSEAKKMKLDKKILNNSELENEDDNSNLSRRDSEFTSEHFKIEICGLPRHTGYGQLRKFLTKLGLEPKKVKMPKGEAWQGGALVTFSNDEEREKGLKIINSGAKMKGRVLKATKSKASADPYLKAQSKNEDTSPETPADLEARFLRAVVPFQHMTYAEQLELKQKKMGDLMRHDVENPICKVNDDLYAVIHANRMQKRAESGTTGPRCEMLPILASPTQEGYRNKNEFTVGYCHEVMGGQVTVGFRLGSYSGGSMTVMNPRNCKHLSPASLTVVDRLEAFFRASPLPPFNPQNHEGYWRMLTVRTSELGHVMIVAAMHTQGLTNDEVQKTQQELTSFILSDASLVSLPVRSLYFSRVGSSNRESDPTFELLHGTETIEETLAKMEFTISPDAFFQANTLGAELLLNLVGDWLREPSASDKDEGELVDVPLLDICCGTGTIGLALSKTVKKVYGIEVIEKAIENAKKNAQRNGIENVEFICGKAEEVLPEILEKNLGTAEKLAAVVDPPRAGLHKRVVQAIRRCSAIQRFVYVSCNPKLAKENFLDLARPCSKGFKGTPFLPVKAVPIDLFPQTNHCELVMLFERVTDAQIESAKTFMKSTCPNQMGANAEDNPEVKPEVELKDEHAKQTQTESENKCLQSVSPNAKVKEENEDGTCELKDALS